jgi:tetratricopeptide (TPR) repeat protein
MFGSKCRVPLVLIALFAILVGCATTVEKPAVMTQEEPAVKSASAEGPYEGKHRAIPLLKRAGLLFDELNRPQEAEKLVRDAIDICIEDKDDYCLGDAFRFYGFFFVSNAVRTEESYYLEFGFLDTEATYPERYQQAMAYFIEATDIFIAYERFDAAANIASTMGDVYHSMAAIWPEYAEPGCQEYDNSIAYIEQYRRLWPGVETLVPPQYSSWEEFIGAKQSYFECD